MSALILPTELAPGVRPAPGLGKLRRQLDALLSDTAQDLDVAIDLGDRPREGQPTPAEHELRRYASDHGKLVILPILRPLADERSVELRLVGAMPGQRNLRLRVEQASEEELPVRAVVMLRDLVAERDVEPGKAPAGELPPLASPTRSSGRAILAVNGTLYGGFIGYSLQRSAGSDDPRLLYPLMAVGAGVGLGSAIIVADEWDVSAAEAWYLAASAWWPAVAGHLIHEGRFGHGGADEAWSFGLVSSAAGLSLGVVGLLPGDVGDGGAVLAHSGGGLGLVVGGLTEFAISGVNDEVPHAGLGYGAAAGWLIGSSTAIWWHPEPGRVLSIDLGCLLGGLVGASAASPLLFDEPSEDKTRGWVAATGGGLAAGGVVAWWLSSDDEDEPELESHAPGRWVAATTLPQPAPIGADGHGPGGWGVAWQGQLW